MWRMRGKSELEHEKDKIEAFCRRFATPTSVFERHSSWSVRYAEAVPITKDSVEKADELEEIFGLHCGLPC